MMDDLISRSALMKELEQRHLDDVFIKRGLQPMHAMSLECNRALKAQGDAIGDVINNMPTVDAEPVRHGAWIKIARPLHGDNRRIYYKYHCSECGGTADDRHWLPNYCPTCGAKMDLED